MGLIERALSLIFGGGRTTIKDTVEVFRENAEGAAVRELEMRSSALDQFAGEFALPRQGWFDRAMDGVNRLPRPALALGTLALFISAMIDPIWFAERMQGISLVPEPLWWLLGAIVSFYFGARHQAKGQAFQRSIAETVTRAGEVTRNIAELRSISATSLGVASTGPDAELEIKSTESGSNPALDEWRGGK